MIDPCDNCNKPCCYGCEHADNKDNEQKEYLINKVHQAEQIVWWLSYQPEMSDSDKSQLKRMSGFLEDLRKRIE